MDSIKKFNFTYDVNESDNMLFLLFNEILFTFNGDKWGQIYINDFNLPGTDFRLLKKPALVEITSLNDSVKTFLILGGFLPNSKSFQKTVFLLNIKKNIDIIFDKEIITYDCLLDFKFGDMKTSRFLHNALNVDNKYVIVVGGKNEKGWLKSCEYLNLTTGEWKDFSGMNNPRANFDCLIYEKDYITTLYVYGGYSDVGKFADCLIEYCRVDMKTPENSKWQNIKITFDNELNLPKICTRILRYDDNILIIGGSDGKHLIKEIFEFDPESKEINQVGELNTPRNNFHLLAKSGDVYVVGGSCKQFLYQDNMIENYAEKFTFNLASQVESNDIAVPCDIFLSTFQNLSINQLEFDIEPGFPYYNSIISKEI